MIRRLTMVMATAALLWDIPEAAAGQHTVRILTYNVHMFGPTVGNAGVVANFFSNLFGGGNIAPRLYYQDETRADQIVQRILSGNFPGSNGQSPDIVAFQELWDGDIADRIKSGLSGLYPNVYRPRPNGSTDIIGAIQDGDSSKLSKILGSGLMLVGKKEYKFTDLDFTEYDDLVDEDMLATKGFGKTIVEASVDGDDFKFCMLLTHTQTGENRNYGRLKDGLQKIANKVSNVKDNHPGVPVFVVGDLNLKGEERTPLDVRGIRPTENYQLLIQGVLGNEGLIDSYRVVNPLNAGSQPRGYTSDPYNVLGTYFSGWGDGLVVKTAGAGDEYLIQGGTRRWFPDSVTRSSIAASAPPKVLSPDDLNAIPLAENIPTRRSGTLYIGAGSLFSTGNDALRHLIDPQMEGTYAMNPWLRPSSRDFQAMGVGAPVLFSSLFRPRPAWSTARRIYVGPKGDYTPEAAVRLEDCAGYAPFFAIIGVGARAENSNLKTLVIVYAPIKADGTLDNSDHQIRYCRGGSEPNHTVEQYAILPDGHVLTGFGISVTDNNVSQVVLYGRRLLSNGTLGTQVVVKATEHNVELSHVLPDLLPLTPGAFVYPDSTSPDQGNIVTGIGLGVTDSNVTTLQLWTGRMNFVFDPTRFERIEPKLYGDASKRIDYILYSRSRDASATVTPVRVTELPLKYSSPLSTETDLSDHHALYGEYAIVYP